MIDKIKKEIAKLISEASGNKVKAEDISRPPSLKMGDFAYPCFELAKEFKKSPQKAAEELRDKIKPNKKIIQIENTGPYLNFFLKPEFLNKRVIENCLNPKKQKAKKEKIMIEYSQPNTHKEFHVGHLRNVCLGSSLANILKERGYKVIEANYIGDTGSHVAKFLWAYLKFYKGEKPPQEKSKWLGKIYAEGARMTREDKAAAEEAAEINKKLEEGDRGLVKLWQKTKNWSMQAFKNIYSELGVKFDVYFYESQEEKEGKKILPQLLKLKEIKKSQGAVIADLRKYDLDVLVLMRADGTALYGIKDIPLAMKKFKEYKIDKSIYVVDARQSFYFQQLFKILELLGFKKEMIHLGYEFVTLKEGAMSSRTGNVVYYDDFKKEVFKQAFGETQKRHRAWSKKKLDETSLKISLAAMKFEMAKQDPAKKIVFDIKAALDFNGDTGPYLQYTAARINSIIKKSFLKTSIKKTDYSLLGENEEKELVKLLSKFEEVLESAGEGQKPSIVAHYLLDLAKQFNNFYHQVPVLQAKNRQLTEARLSLAKAVKEVLEKGLNLLGIEDIEEM